MNDDMRHRILLAADNAGDRRLVAEVLGQAGYTVDAAADGQQTIEAAAAGGYDLVLMDLSLSGPDGVEVTRYIRRLPYPRGGVPILALAAMIAAADRDRCCAAGMDGFFPKPIDPPQLLEAVAQWVEAADDPTWGLDERPGVVPPLVNRRTLAQLEEDLGAELLPEILATFLHESERRLILLEARVTARDAAGAAEEAHALKGSSATFGAMALRQAVQEMERSGRAGDGARLTALMPQVRHLVVVTCNLLRAQYSLPVPEPLPR